MAGFRKLLVPLDGSHLAEAVLPVARVLAERFGADVSLLHVMERDAPETVHGQPHLSSLGEAEVYLERAARDCSCLHARVECHVHPNEERDVVGSILRHAEEFGADLVLISTHGWGGMRDLLVGSIAQQTLRRGRLPVLLVKPPEAAEATPFEPHRILAPLDMTEEHDAPVLPLAEELGKVLRADLLLLVVVPTLSTISNDRAAIAAMAPTATREALRMEEEEARGYLRRLSERLRQENVGVSTEVRRGDTASSVVEVAGRAQADMIVMSTHGRAGWDAFWSGSTGSKILSRIRQPMLLVRARE